MKKVLLDTDVILDFFFDRKPFSDSASKILSLCEKKMITGFLTPVIISNAYYLLRQNATHQKVIDKLTLLLSFLELLVMDKKIILQALESDFKDFEDALQNYAAEKSQSIDAIITRNIKDYKNSKLNILNPDEFLTIYNNNDKL